MRAKIKKFARLWTFAARLMNSHNLRDEADVDIQTWLGDHRLIVFAREGS